MICHNYGGLGTFSFKCIAGNGELYPQATFHFQNATAKLLREQNDESLRIEENRNDKQNFRGEPQNKDDLKSN